jgi:hypothetical protein
MKRHSVWYWNTNAKMQFCYMHCKLDDHATGDSTADILRDGFRLGFNSIPTVSLPPRNEPGHLTKTVNSCARSRAIKTYFKAEPRHFDAICQFLVEPALVLKDF